MTFRFLVILLLVLPNIFIVSSVKSSRWYPIFILNVILISIFFTYILIEGFSVAASSFFKIYPKKSWISGTEYDPSGNSNFSFHFGADILNLLFFYYFFIFFHV